MIEEYIESYKKLPLKDKRDILIKDMSETLNTIESLCNKKNVSIDKLKSNYYIKNRELLFEEEYYDLLFVYLVYMKEDLALLL